MKKAGDATVCKICDEPLPSSGRGEICPRCLLAGAMEQLGMGDPAGAPTVSGAPENGEASPSARPRANVPAPMPAPEELAPLFPELEVQALVGSGGMGAVYKARQPRLDRFVALKLLKRSLAEDAEFVSRFEREARALARLDHPNIVTIYDFGERGGYLYFIMEYVHGGDLQQWIRRGQIEPSKVLELVPQICKAIQFAHDEGITHRDIKPANILLDKRGRVKVADFGLAKILGADTEIGLTVTGSSMGTPFYMAPEQCVNPEKADERADIYSLGVLMYEMLTGEIPVGHFGPPSSKSAAVDSKVDAAVLRAMAQDPDLRFHEVRELLEALEIARDRRRQRRKPAKKSSAGPPAWTWVGAIGVLTALAAGAGIVWQPWRKEPAEERPVVAAPQPADPPRVAEPEMKSKPGRLDIRKPTAKPGRLRSWGQAFDQFGAAEPLDLKAFEGLDDLVQVRASFDGKAIVALRSNGTLVANHENEVTLKGLREINDKHRIRWIGYSKHGARQNICLTDHGEPVGIHPDAAITKLLPEVAEPVVDVRTNSLFPFHGLLLTESGRVIPWGENYQPDAENRWPLPADEVLENVVEIAANTRSVFVLKADGTVRGWDRDGMIDLPVEMASGIRSIANYYDNLAALSEDGWLYQAPERDRFERISLKEEVSSRQPLKNFNQTVPLYQDDSGSWTSPWGDLGLDHPMDDLHNQLPEIEGLPADAFAIGGTSATPGRFLLWIEPASAEPDLIEPLPLETEPGRLRGVGMGRKGEQLISLDLAPAEGLTDLVQIVAHYDGFWAALRSNGEVVSNNPIGFSEESGIHRFGQRMGSEWNTLYIDVEGGLRSSHKTEIPGGHLPEVNRPVIDAATVSNGLLLLNNGQAVAWGLPYDDADWVASNPYIENLWPRPSPSDLENVRAVSASGLMAAVLKADGSVVAWGENGRIDLPAELRSGIVEIGCTHYPSLLAVHEDGRLFQVNRNGKLEGIRAGDAVDVTPGDSVYFPALYRDREGDWKFVADHRAEDFRAAHPEVVAAMSNLKELPPEAFYLRLSEDPGTEAFLLWIEPAAGEPESQPAVKLEPRDPETQPGRLRGLGWFRIDGKLTSVDLSVAEDYADLVQVRAKPSGGLAVLRANGEVVSNWPAAFESRSKIRRFGQDRSRHHDLMYIDRTGDVIPCHPGRDLNVGEPPEVDRPVVAASLASSNGLLLLNDGRAIPWGRVYDNEPENYEWSRAVWPRPDEKELSRVRAIEAGFYVSAVLREDGSVFAWGEHGVLDLPAAFSFGVRQIAIANRDLFALDENGKTWACDPGGRPLDHPHYPRQGVRQLDGNDRSILYQTEDGEWRFLDQDGMKEAQPEIVAALSNLKGLPRDAFDWFVSKDREEAAYVFWIEPVTQTPP